MTLPQSLLFSQMQGRGLQARQSQLVPMNERTDLSPESVYQVDILPESLDRGRATRASEARPYR
jgi:hypothetical protein